MARITIAKALKKKNELAGQLKELQMLFNSCNSYELGTVQKFDATELMGEIVATKLSLTNLQILIQQKNARIVDKLVRMKETKAEIAWLRTIPTTEGEVSSYDRYSDEKVAKKKMIALYDAVWVRSCVKLNERVISNLQDEIDEFNATTFIEFEEAKVTIPV